MPSGYTTTAGPSLQTSKQPALCARMVLFNPRSFNSSLNFFTNSIPRSSPQHFLPSFSLVQLNICFSYFIFLKKLSCLTVEVRRLVYLFLRQTSYVKRVYFIMMGPYTYSA